jgi:carbonic anhydrase
MSSGKIQKIREEVEQVKPGKGFIIDLSRVIMMDASGAEQIIELVEFITHRGSRVALQGLSQGLQKVLVLSDRTGSIANIFAVGESDIERILAGSEPNIPIDRLTFGVERFRKNASHYQSLFNQLAHNQSPHTLFITCSDSRISPNLITSTDPGELFVVRNVGNIVPKHGFDATPAEGAAVEFAIQVLGVQEIVICAHSECGAMKAIISKETLSGLPNLQQWLSDSCAAHSHLPLGSSADDAAKNNALIQIDHLKTYPLVRKQLEENKIRIHAWFYNIGTGDVERWDEKSKKFILVGENMKNHLKIG